MNPRRLIIATILAVNLTSLPTSHAQKPVTPAPGVPAGTCRCCDLGRIYAPYLKKLPAPRKRNNIGNSHLEITTNSKAAQQWFDQGLNLLHSFWEFEAYRCFLQAAKEDPKCAMAYWGICMSLPGKNTESAAERKLALDKAKSLAADPARPTSAREKMYIEMIDGLIHRGTQAAVPKLRDIIKQYPNDVDATAFLALWLRDGYKYPNGGKAPARVKAQVKAQANPGSAEAIELLQAALKKHPLHTGLNHYYIHVLEQGPDFEQARAAALALPKAAPGAGHLVHMPGHIYYLAGEYEKACQAFRDCHQVETEYLRTEAIPPVDNNNYLHNLHFLAFAASDQGRYKEALQAAFILADTKVPKNRQNAIGAHQIYYLASTVTALVHMRAGKYDLAAASLFPESVPNECGASHYILFLRSYCRLRHLITHPKEVNYRKILRREKLALSRHFNALRAAKPTTSMESQPWQQAYTACKILINEARAWLDNPEPNEKFKKPWANIAVRDHYRSPYAEPPLLITPVEESLGWLALHAGHPAEARNYFESSLQQRRQSGHAYLGMARSYRQENNPTEACSFYQKFLTAFALADKNLPELGEAQHYLKQHSGE